MAAQPAQSQKTETRTVCHVPGMRAMIKGSHLFVLRNTTSRTRLVSLCTAAPPFVSPTLVIPESGFPCSRRHIESYAGFSLSTAHCVSWKGSRDDTYRRNWTRRRDGCRRPFMSRQLQLECGLQPGDGALSLARQSDRAVEIQKCPWHAVKWLSVEAGLLGGT